MAWVYLALYGCNTIMFKLDFISYENTIFFLYMRITFDTYVTQQIDNE